MSSNNSAATSCGPCLCTLLTVLFVGLKLTDYIDWSWWWVLSPLWIGLALFLFIMAIVLGFAALIGAFK